MSFRTRVRALQSLTNLSYQQCLNNLQALGRLPLELSQKTGWTIAEADAFIAKNGFDSDAVDPDLDLSGARHISVTDCDCGMQIIYGMDKKGMPLTPYEREPTRCHQCRGGLSEEELCSCGRCGSPNSVVDEDDWCDDCQSSFNHQMSKDD